MHLGPILNSEITNKKHKTKAENVALKKPQKDTCSHFESRNKKAERHLAWPRLGNTRVRPLQFKHTACACPQWPHTHNEYLLGVTNRSYWEMNLQTPNPWIMRANCPSSSPSRTCGPGILRLFQRVCETKTPFAICRNATALSPCWYWYWWCKLRHLRVKLPKGRRRRHQTAPFIAVIPTTMHT